MTSAKERQAAANYLYAWLSNMATWQYPDKGTDAARVLADAGIKTPARFTEFRLMLVFIATEYGEHGQGMEPGQRAIAGACHKGRQVVTAWMAAAVALLAIRQTAPAQPPFKAAEYAVAPFWESPTQVSAWVPDRAETGPDWLQNEEPPY